MPHSAAERVWGLGVERKFVRKGLYRMKKKENGYITAVTKLDTDVASMWLKAEGVAREARPGQFVNLYCQDGSRMLPRPISICQIDREEGLLRLVFRVVGEGTREFAGLGAGEHIALAGPLGNGFTIEGERAVLLGGGIGIPPMLELARELSGQGKEVCAVLGYRSGPTFLAEEFAPYGRVVIATEDGSSGTKGNVIDALRENGIVGDILYACGPTPMLRGVKQYAGENGLRAQISLEERMACGIGACLACVCQSKEVDPHTHVHNKRICKDGPVFEAGEVEL